MVGRPHALVANTHQELLEVALHPQPYTVSRLEHLSTRRSILITLTHRTNNGFPTGYFEIQWFLSPISCLYERMNILLSLGCWRLEPIASSLIRNRCPQKFIESRAPRGLASDVKLSLEWLGLARKVTVSRGVARNPERKPIKGESYFKVTKTPSI
jgi:hypothetical protein